MNIKIIGCGHIGAINAYCLAKMGNTISVSEIDDRKLLQLSSAEPLFSEKGFDWPYFYKNISIAHEKTAYDIALICVDAKIENGDYQLDSLAGIVREEAEKQKTVLIRTTLGGQGVEKLRKLMGECQNVYYWPEFLREGSAINDFMVDTHYIAPLFRAKNSIIPKIGISGRVTKVDCAVTLAFVKMYSNAFRALKLTFANSVAYATSKFDISHELFTEIFCELRGNCDSAYLRPGDPFGGFCLPKETDAAAELALLSGITDECNIFSSINKFNAKLIEDMAGYIDKYDVSEISMVGLEFKVGTSDTRNSPYLQLSNYLTARGIKVKTLDSNGRPPRFHFARDFDAAAEDKYVRCFKFSDLYNRRAEK